MAWSVVEDYYLQQHAASGLADDFLELAGKLGKSVKAVKKRLEVLGINPEELTEKLAKEKREARIKGFAVGGNGGTVAITEGRSKADDEARQSTPDNYLKRHEKNIHRG